MSNTMSHLTAIGILAFVILSAVIGVYLGLALQIGSRRHFGAVKAEVVVSVIAFLLIGLGYYFLSCNTIIGITVCIPLAAVVIGTIAGKGCTN